MSLVDNEATQIKVRIACREPRNINVIPFDAKNIMNIISVLFGPKNIIFGNILYQKYLTFVSVCACAECPLGSVAGMDMFDIYPG